MGSYLKRQLKKILIWHIKILNHFLPKFNWIIYTSTPDLSDNSLAFYKYSEKYWNGKYKYFWIVSDLEYTRKVVKVEGITDIRLIKYNTAMYYIVLLLSKLHVDTIGAGYKKFNFSKYPVMISLWHGSPIKKVGRGILNDIDVCEQDYLVGASKYFEFFLKEDLLSKHGKIIFSGFPRNDWLLGHIESTNNFELLNTIDYIVWMPTFKISKSNFGRFKDGPLIQGNISFLTLENLNELNSYLYNIGMVLMIKFHPYDIMNESSYLKYSNIEFIKAESDAVLGSKLYGLLKTSKGLITDYSSVVFDYMLTGMPIGIDMKSCESYTRELYFDLDMKSFDSHKINDLNDLYQFCLYCKNNNKIFPVSEKYNKASKSSFSENIINYLEQEVGL